MKLEQIFYGRGSSGYKILGSSIPEGVVTRTVVELCGAIGTPPFDREEDREPFLLQKHFGELLLMICAGTGQSDSLGRGTMFFHVLVGSAREAEKQGITALSLWRDGRFSSALASEKVVSVDYAGGDTSSVRDEGESPIGLPAVVKCTRNENLILIARLGKDSLNGNWASFSWNHLSGFDYVGLDERRSIKSLPKDTRVYDSNFVQLRSGNESGGDICRTSDGNVKKGRKMKSLIIAAILAFALGFVVRGFVSSMDVGSGGGLRDVERSAEKVITKFKMSEPIESAELESVLGEALYRKSGLSERRDKLLPKLRRYVDFVNDNFIEPKDREM